MKETCLDDVEVVMGRFGSRVVEDVDLLLVGVTSRVCRSLLVK